MTMARAGVIIIGSGIAGLMAAHLLADDFNVIVLTKSKLTTSNSKLAQGGIAAALHPNDNWKKHFEDTLRAGYGHHLEHNVELMVKRAPELITYMANLGVPFDRTKTQGFKLGMEGAHQERRIVHADGDQTGKAFVMTLLEKIKGRVEVMEKTEALSLVKENGQVIGVQTDKCLLKADFTIIATGGIGQLYTYTSNARTTTGDGMALAYRAGAMLSDLEFIQFHPTLLLHQEEVVGLASEALRGEGARLVDENGFAIMSEHPNKDLAPRDVVSRKIYDYQAAGKKVFLDISSIEKFSERFPQVFQICQRAGIKLDTSLLEVAPGAHFISGGINTNEHGETSLPALYALGEVACTGVHGANRLASNSLLEGLVFAERAVLDIREKAKSLHFKGLQFLLETDLTQKEESVKLPSLEHLRMMMTQFAGIKRTEAGLKKVIDWLRPYQPWLEQKSSFAPKQMEEANQLLIALLICQSALARTESRGGHFRLDYPKEQEGWLKTTLEVKINQPIRKKKQLISL
ncbi:hypothetical protein AJ85_16555 [Alkalihalobacillus alcalophilus ATCC 27647 = CGMCC 1.3604]|uniref:L-aspartate oxidase n=2 Tax=Alkalihalobacillus alcalophilus ATCC 27647 = CGMCC 1.3604 TaxID=1218173 RepID=A0A4S4JWJ0_ALKAL|nr:L-aspartate oxidase [Alkalihalobacillus alcalophilus]MED1561024.1 L-aspartate oxidase [Alkalihalobacillus alcalophilus]THG89573.1 hypothetical protein AJ85_16555 [Alkalihalobacillus alcalophilus ATCC 27647 = CGMCC 1.3604]